MSEQRFVPGRSFNPRKPLVIDGAYLLDVEEHYPEIAALARREPSWESTLFIIFPVSEVRQRRLLEVIAGLEEGVNNPRSIYDHKRRLVAVVNYQTGYKAYVALYTYRLEE